MKKTQEEFHDIVIVGGGISGLASALALHRKGIQSLVLERSETLRATGAAISIYLNGWHALDQLGVGDELRKKSVPITEYDKSLFFLSYKVILHGLWLSVMVSQSSYSLYDTNTGEVVIQLTDSTQRIRIIIAKMHNCSTSWLLNLNMNVNDILILLSISRIHDESVNQEAAQVIPSREEGLQCVKRSDLIETMARRLPTGSIRFGCQIVAVETDHVNTFPTVYLEDGSIIKTKVLIGCDGSNSVVARTLGLKAPKLFQKSEVRGFTSYPDGHKFSTHFLHLRGDKFFLGRIPVDEKLVFWFVDQEFQPKDLETRKDPKLIRDQTMEALTETPKEVTEMVKHCDLSSLSLVRIRYRAPWHLAFSKLCRGTMTVAGDAMHQMDPGLGQGGCAALEDAVVLARCLAIVMPRGSGSGSIKGREDNDEELQKRVGVALRKYTRERRWRILLLSTKSYLVGSLFQASWLKRIVFLSIFGTFFGGRFGHTQYNCGHL